MVDHALPGGGAGGPGAVGQPARRLAARRAQPQAAMTLEVGGLKVEFPSRRGTLTALDGVSFAIERGEVLGVVGESCAGKSITGLGIIGLLDARGRIAAGEVWLEGRRIDHLGQDALRRVRGRRIGVIFQDPLTALNPLYTIGKQLEETILTHLAMTQAQARSRPLSLLSHAPIPAPQPPSPPQPPHFSPPTPHPPPLP